MPKKVECWSDLIRRWKYLSAERFSTGCSIKHSSSQYEGEGMGLVPQIPEQGLHHHSSSNSTPLLFLFPQPNSRPGPATVVRCGERGLGGCLPFPLVVDSLIDHTIHSPGLLPPLPAAAGVRRLPFPRLPSPSCVCAGQTAALKQGRWYGPGGRSFTREGGGG